MLNKNIENALTDYFSGRNYFAKVNDYFGMAASQRSKVFLDYYQGLDGETQIETSRLIMLVACGRHPAFLSDLPRALELLVSLCFSGFTAQFQKNMGILESEFNLKENIENWVVADDNLEPVNGIEFKRTWRYAFSLFNILKMLGSERVDTTTKILRTGAQSDEFRRNLSR